LEFGYWFQGRPISTPSRFIFGYHESNLALLEHGTRSNMLRRDSTTPGVFDNDKGLARDVARPSHKPFIFAGQSRWPHKLINTLINPL
jgi:hypothetical protein